MSCTSQKINSLSSMGSFMGRSGEGVVTGRIVRTESPMTGGSQFLGQPWRIGIALLCFHPAKERLAGDLAGVGVAPGQLPLNEFLNRLCDRDLHVIKLAQDSRQDNRLNRAKIAEWAGV